MIAQIKSLDVQNLEVTPYPSYTYRIDDTRIVGVIDGIDSIRQSVRHILTTERYAYPIYPRTYGIELQQLVGADYGYVEANIGRIVKDALMQDDRIVSVSIDSINKIDIDSVHIYVTVMTNLGTFTEGAIISV